MSPIVQLVVAGAYGNRTHRGAVAPQTVLKSCPGGRAPNSNLHHARNDKHLRPSSRPPFRAVRAWYRVRGGTVGGQRLRGALVALAFAVACRAPGAPTWPGEPFAPPAAWRALWDATAACAAVDPIPSFERVRWYVSSEGALGPQVLGRWEPPHNIWLTAWVVGGDFEPTIAHEILHDQLQLGGDERWHPPAFERCGL